MTLSPFYIRDDSLLFIYKEGLSPLFIEGMTISPVYIRGDSLSPFYMRDDSLLFLYKEGLSPLFIEGMTISSFYMGWWLAPYLLRILTFYLREWISHLSIQRRTLYPFLYKGITCFSCTTHSYIFYLREWLYHLSI